MTIKVYLDKAREAGKRLTPVGHTKPYAEALEENTDIWSNEACKGYAVMGMKNAGLKRKTIEKVLYGMHWAFSEATVDEAAQHYADY